MDEVLAAHPGEVARFRGGEAKLIGFLVGQVMKKSGGKADPKGGAAGPAEEALPVGAYSRQRSIRRSKKRRSVAFLARPSAAVKCSRARAAFPRRNSSSPMAA